MFVRPPIAECRSIVSNSTRKVVSALIVNQFMESRIRLQQTLERLSDISYTTQSVHSLDEALALLIGGNRFNLYFISGEFDANDIVSFLDRLRRIDRSGSSANILLLSHGSTNSDLVAQHMLCGMHGFLCEPYSEEGLRDSIRLARSVALQQSGDRLRAAAGLMLYDIMDEHESSKGAQVKGKDLWTRVKETCDTYKQLTGESVTNAVIQPMKSSNMETRSTTYRGVSKRVRDLFRKKFRERLKASR